MNSFTIFQLMYIILDGLNDENPNENIITFLTDANPFMREGENSVDVAVYNDFKKKFNEYNNHSDYSYEFVRDYLKNIDYYKDVYQLFASISKEEYVDNCEDVLNNNEIELKKC